MDNEDRASRGATVTGFCASSAMDWVSWFRSSEAIEQLERRGLQKRAWIKVT